VEASQDSSQHKTALKKSEHIPQFHRIASPIEQVVLTDYPEAILIDNLEFNSRQNLSPDEQDHVETQVFFFGSIRGLPDCSFFQGYIWGHPVDNIMRALPKDASTGFHLIILSDLIFNHSQVGSLCTIQSSVSQRT